MRCGDQADERRVSPPGEKWWPGQSPSQRQVDLIDQLSEELGLETRVPNTKVKARWHIANLLDIKNGVIQGTGYGRPRVADDQ